VTGKPTIGKKYAASTRAHSETVLRTFYDFHLASNSGSLLVTPSPLDRSRRRGRANAHHNPMEDFKARQTGRYRPRVPERIPRRIPDDKYTEVFAGLRSHRDRALLASWVSTGARSEELLTSRERDAIPGQQLIGVGEVEGLSTSLAAAEDKIAQIEAQQEKKQSPVFLGIPNLAQITARTGEATG
jgi:hypothetical protein